MHSKTVLLIDDARDEGHKKIHRRVDIIARNYWTGIECLKLRKWDLLLLDHDLNSFEDIADATTEKTGYDIMCFLEQNPEYLPKKIELVTSNPAGRKNMQLAIDAIKRRGLL